MIDHSGYTSHDTNDSLNTKDSGISLRTGYKI